MIVPAGFGEEVEAKEPDQQFGLPRSLTDTQFDVLRERPPFTRVLNLSDSVRLTGLAVIDGEQIATVRDRDSGKSFVVSEKPNENGWKMMGIESSNELDGVTATLSAVGGEVINIQFDEEQLNPKPRAKGTDSIKVNRSLVKKPPPTEEERRRFGEWVRGRMSKMSEEQRKRVGQIMKEKMKANPNLTDRQKGDIFVKILDHVAPRKK